jgi:hypothetical protein
MSDTVVKSNESILSLTNHSKSPSAGHHSWSSTHIDDISTTTTNNNSNQYRSSGETALAAIDNSGLQDRDDADGGDDGDDAEGEEELPPLPPLPPPSPDVS